MDFSFDTHPDHYRHWQLTVGGEAATLTLLTQVDGGLAGDYKLKLNSYDLGVDIELADAIMRLRFEHPETKVVVLKSGLDRVFCAGANIPMLATSSHGFKVNFCKFTNETRLAMEDASLHSDQKYITALQGTCAGGGYELALACDEILLVDDGNSSVSLPEVSLLGVLPGTGGLTRLIDKRHVRRDVADVFCTLQEGVRAPRALEWGLVDAVATRSGFESTLASRIEYLARTTSAKKKGGGIPLDRIEPEMHSSQWKYRFVNVVVTREKRTAEITISAPDEKEDTKNFENGNAQYWPLRCFREIDDALLRLRFHEPEIGVLLLRTRGNPKHVQRVDDNLHTHRCHWLANEILHLQKRVLKRLDLTSKSIFALFEPESCFVGSLFELALAADRIFVQESSSREVAIALSPLNAYAYPMSNGLTRLSQRFSNDAKRVHNLTSSSAWMVGSQIFEAGLATSMVDESEWRDEIRMAVEERASLSPDALTGLEASLRFSGPETMETRILGRLSAWQNWIFQRPNAVGPTGTLVRYGKPERPELDFTRC